VRHQLCIDGTIYCQCTARAVGDDSKAHAVVAICRPARSPPYSARALGRTQYMCTRLPKPISEVLSISSIMSISGCPNKA
jgi:hypothetical protein